MLLTLPGPLLDCNGGTASFPSGNIWDDEEFGDRMEGVKDAPGTETERISRCLSKKVSSSSAVIVVLTDKGCKVGRVVQFAFSRFHST